MCGFLGILRLGGGFTKPQIFKEALDLIARRGPDASGFVSLAFSNQSFQTGLYPESDLLLGHRRLSIIDTSELGHQPMQLKASAIAYNGEVYNYKELREKFLSAEQFRSNSDTEVVLRLLNNLGTKAFEYFRGMFAFAYVDITRGELILARDHFGIKPLYFSRTGTHLAFGSEIRPLLHLLASRQQVNREALTDFLKFGISDHSQDTFFENIFSLEPGHFVRISLRSGEIIEKFEFWRPIPGRRQFSSFDAARDSLRSDFDESVRMHLRSDVPIALTLSGGTDSSAILASTARQMDGELTCFSFTPPQSKISEKPWIDLVSKHFNVRSIQISPEVPPLSAAADGLILQQGEPFGSLSIVAQHLVYKGIHEAGYKVSLGGQGADEIFAGYPFYIFGRIASLIRSNQTQMAIELFRARFGNSPRQAALGLMWLRRFGLLKSLRPVELWLESLTLSRALSRKFLNTTHSRFRPYSDLSEVTLISVLQHSIRFFLPHLLRYEDRNAMFFSIENRVPFLWPELVEDVLSLPEEWLISSEGDTKYVLRQMFSKDFPERLARRKDKVPFLSPQKDWLLESKDWVREVLSDVPSSWRHVFKPEYLNNLRSGTAAGDRFAWRVINVLRWAQIYDVVGPDL